MAAYFDIRGTATKLIAATIGTLTVLTAIVVSGSFRLSQQPSGRILYTESNGVVTTTPSLAYTSSTATVGVTNLTISGTCTGCGATLNPFTGNIIPTTNNSQDLGSAVTSVRAVYASGTSQLANVSSTAISSSGSINGATGNFSSTVSINSLNIPSGGTFGSGGIQVSTISRISPVPLSISGGETTDAATNVGVKIGSYRDFSTAGGQPVQFLDGSTIVGGFGYLGQFFVGTSSTGLGAATTTGIFNFGSAPTSTIQNGYSGRPSCMVYGDSDGSGLTYCTWNNGVQTCSTTPCT